MLSQHLLPPLVQKLLLQHSSALRKRSVGLTYACWLTSVKQAPLQTTIPQLNSETVPTYVICSWL